MNLVHRYQNSNYTLTINRGTDQPNSVYYSFSPADYIQTRPIARQLIFLGKITDYWEVIQPLYATIEFENDGTVIIYDKEFMVYGSGDTIQEANKDFVQSLIEYYELLSEYDDAPSQDLFNKLKKYLQPT